MSERDEAAAAERVGYAFDVLSAEARLLCQDMPPLFVIRAALAVVGRVAAEHRIPACQLLRNILDMLDFFTNGPKKDGP